MKRAALWRGVLSALLTLFVQISFPGLAVSQSCPANIPHVTGTWEVLAYRMPINPISANLMPNGKVLIVAGSENVSTNSSPGAQSFRVAVWDPNGSGAASIVAQNVEYDVFCSHVTQLADGRSFVVGGTSDYTFTGDSRSSIFDWQSNTFMQSQSMSAGRWYGSAVTLGDGRVVAMSGLENTGGVTKIVEIYDLRSGGAGWTKTTDFANGNVTPPLYPRIVLLPSGKVYFTGQGSGASTANSWFFNPANGTWTASAAVTTDRAYGGAVLLPLLPPDYKPKVMNFGGHSPALSSTELIDLSAATPAWTPGPKMLAPRIEMNAVLLPNGTVLAEGGSGSNESPDAGGRSADLYNTSNNTMGSAGSSSFSRLYHSTTVLLPDARVAVLGSNPGGRGSFEPAIEIYTPPYLFDANDRLVTNRPAITAMAPASGVLNYGSAFSVSYSAASPIRSVVLMRLGSSTHALTMEQRMIGLCGPAPQPACTQSNSTLTLTVPPNGNVAPPGYYLLFLLDTAGVPSVAEFIQLTPYTTVAPHANITTPNNNVTIQAGETVSFGTTSSASKYSWIFPGGTPGTSTTQNPGSISFAHPGVYTASLTAIDSGGNSDPHPSVRKITVLAKTADFTVSVGATAVEVAPGGTASFPIKVTAQSGFTGAVSLSVASESGFPQGVTQQSFAPPTINGSGSSTLTMATSTSSLPYALSLAVVGTSGTIKHTASTTLIIRPPTPSSLTANPGNSQVSLTWPAATGAQSYEVKRGTVSGGPYLTLACTDATSFINTGLANGANYFYVVSGIYTQGPNGGGASPDSSQATATPVGQGSGGSLQGSSVASSAAVNLTAIGTSDWAKWPNYIHKASGGTQIPTLAVIGAGSLQAYNDDQRAISWTDGTPTATGTNDKNGNFVAGINNGFKISAPADSAVRTLYVYVGGWKSGGKLTAHLSDSSAADYVDTSFSSTSGQYKVVYTLTYRAASSGQRLVAQWIQTSGVGNVTLQAVALAGGHATPPPVPSGVAASDGTSSSSVAVSWTPSSGATSYTVYRSTTQGVQGSSLGSTNTTSMTDTSATPGTLYYYSVTATGAGGTSASSVQDSGYAGTLTSSGSLKGSGAAGFAGVNLTTVGTGDWAKWPSYIHKVTGGSKIKDITKIGTAALNAYSDDQRPISWTDGTPTATGTNDRRGNFVQGTGNGFQITAPADTTTRTLLVYVGGWSSGGKLVAHLSDGSAADFVDSSFSSSGAQYKVTYTLTYRAASAGKQLVVKWTQASGSGNVTVQAAALK